MSLVDLAPTLTACTGSPDIPCVDGESLLPILRDEADPGRGAQRPVFSEVEILPHLPPARMVRRGRYKYVYYHDDRDTLFDIEADPTEQHNLLGGMAPGDRPEAEHAALAEELRRLALDEWDPEQLGRNCRRNWERRGHDDGLGADSGQPPAGSHGKLAWFPRVGARPSATPSRLPQRPHSLHFGPHVPENGSAARAGGGRARGAGRESGTQDELPAGEILAIREQGGLSRREFARKTVPSVNSVWNREKAHSKPRAGDLGKSLETREQGSDGPTGVGRA